MTDTQNPEFIEKLKKHIQETYRVDEPVTGLELAKSFAKSLGSTHFDVYVLTLQEQVVNTLLESGIIKEARISQPEKVYTVK